jgi:alkylation response protein AidB-like acyl-CoA dehydrogenase
MSESSATAGQDIPTAQTLLERAAAMVPALRERSAHCEQLRRIPPETVDDFRKAGFMRISQPKRFGGYDFTVDVAAQVAKEIGRGCGSSAWMAGQWPGHNFMVSYFPLETQQEYWDGNPDRMSSTASTVARQTIEEELGGWRVRDTQKRFSSGCDEAEWILLYGLTGIGLVPKKDFYVHDDWRVSGLRGTGSKSVIIEDAWIPPHRIVSFEQLMNGATPGARISDNPQVRAPCILVLNQLLLGATIGMAKGILDLFEERVVKRFDLHTGKSAAEGPGVQLRFAEAHAEVEAAEMFLERVGQTLTAWGSNNHVPTMVERTHQRRNITYANRLCQQAGHRLLTSGDASGMFDTNQLGRLGRDLQMAGLQAALVWDEPALSFSRARWNASGEISRTTG